MENATKALLIAAGFLIGVMILSLGVVLFSELNSYVESSNERIRTNKLNEFNRQFVNYLNSDLTIQDVVTAANMAYENNVKNNFTETNAINAARGNEFEHYITVYLNGNPIEHNINERAATLLSSNLGKNFRCEQIEYSRQTGRVYKIYFEE